MNPPATITAGIAFKRSLELLEIMLMRVLAAYKITMSFAHRTSTAVRAPPDFQRRQAKSMTQAVRTVNPRLAIRRPIGSDWNCPPETRVSAQCALKTAAATKTKFQAEATRTAARIKPRGVFITIPVSRRVLITPRKSSGFAARRLAK